MAAASYHSLTGLYENWDRPIITAHRGASGSYPENTALAMRKAVEWGSDMIEFDLRMSKDGVPVLLHDADLDRTSSLRGKVGDYTFAELKEANFSHQNKPGQPPSAASYAQMPIASFEDILQEFRGRVGMNIQVYAGAAGLAEICRLFLRYDMVDHGYLTLASLEEIKSVRELHPAIEICYTPPWQERGHPAQLRLCQQLGCRFVQPVAAHSGPECYTLCRELGLRANAFYSDTDVGNRLLLAQGASGWLSNRPDIGLYSCGR
jgi:glycerophosphoryl diester phosphodiesterase